LGYRKHQGQGHGGGDKAEHKKQGKTQTQIGDVNIQGKAEEYFPFPYKKDLGNKKDDRKLNQGKQYFQGAPDYSPNSRKDKIEKEDPQNRKKVVGDKTGGAENKGLEQFC
jgi:hypothetical protein